MRDLICDVTCVTRKAVIWVKLVLMMSAFPLASVRLIKL